MRQEVKILKRYGAAVLTILPRNDEKAHDRKKEGRKKMCSLSQGR